MLLEIPFTYEAVGFLPRQRTPTTERLLSWIAVRVDELKSADAPVVGTCTWEASSLIHEADGGVADSFEREARYRRHPDGHLLRPAFVDEDFFSLSGAPEGTVSGPIAEAIRQGQGTCVADMGTAQSLMIMDAWNLINCRHGSGLIPHVYGQSVDRVLLGRAAAETSLNRTTSTNLEAAAVLTCDKWAQAAFIDGELHVPSTGPAWVVHQAAVDAVPEAAMRQFDVGLVIGPIEPDALDCFLSGKPKDIPMRGSVEIDISDVPIEPFEIAMRQMARMTRYRMSPRLRQQAAYLEKPQQQRRLGELADAVCNCCDAKVGIEEFLTVLEELNIVFCPYRQAFGYSKDMVDAFPDMVRNAMHLIAAKHPML